MKKNNDRIEFDLSPLKYILDKPQKISIIVHQHPDGDALGSGLALAGILKHDKHDVVVISPSECQNYLKWMPGYSEILIADSSSNITLFKECCERINASDVLFYIDFSSLNRVGSLFSLLEKIVKFIVVIDHHQKPQNLGLLYSDTSAAATAELLYRIIILLGKKYIINKEIANCLYTGLLTDTNSFKNPNTTSESHRIAAELYDLGAETKIIHKHIYASNSINKLKFLGYALCNRLVIIPEFKTAYFCIQTGDLKKFNLNSSDTDGLLSHVMTLNDISVAILLCEKNNSVKISMRSYGNIPVSEWAMKYFNGGGHKNAAGGVSFLSLDDTIKEIKKILKENENLLV